ncbi:glycosyl transferase possibly involved in lipopolysaccharide synthesis [Desulfocurvibacter africanus PCS]|uniref:Glycosyl transferase possibly involved in lipopolysaccharide synthesis n=2 Tax=Desulfocurvibacter africanus TaxID=873 RepID=M5PSW0_DESAF|nr:glycosyl transferase possibly involved in lipopolysaccharide synthesis [Desulfocurvibacter africanus PCS]
MQRGEGFIVLITDMFRRITHGKAGALPMVPGLLDLRNFKRALDKSRQRAERCGHPFALVTFEPQGELEGESGDKLGDELDGLSSNGLGNGLSKLARVVVDRARLSDEAGWCEGGRLGVILYGASGASARIFAESVLGNGQRERFRYVVFAYPGRDGGDGSGRTKSRESGQKDKTSETASKSESIGTQRMDACQGLFAKPHPTWKRLLDIAGSGLALLVASPFMLLAALWIRSVSPGSVFFRQERIGRGGKPFTMLKFRTMAVDLGESRHQDYMTRVITDGEAPMTKLDARDPRIIRGGRLLRKLCIDELPQLLNVMRGDMSLVGPRPPIGYEVAEYQRWCRGRLDCTPGMTGLWQVSGKNRLTFKEMARLDIFYANNFSLWFDLMIILRTPLAIVRQLLDGLGKDQRAKGSAGNV